MPLHPQAEAVVKDIPRVWTDAESMTAAKVRASNIVLSAEAARCPLAGVDTEEIEVPGGDGPLRARVYRPTETPAIGAVLWIHGGGWIAGSLDTETIPAPLALASGCTVVSVEYRLAPEHPFPAALEDCFAAARWLAQQAPELGGRSDRIAVAGASAGGNIAAAVTLMARDRGGPAIVFQLLVVPALAREFDGLSRRDPEIVALGPPDELDWLWQQYLGGHDPSDPLASPLLAETLAGLPPALVITAEYDRLRDEGEAYAERLAHDGVAVEHRRYDGMHHAFPASIGDIDAADECAEYMGAALRLMNKPSGPEGAGEDR